MTRIPNFADVAFEQAAVTGGESNAQPWLTPEGLLVKPSYSEADLQGIDFLDT